MKYLLRSPIVETSRLAADLYRLVVEAPQVASACRPGQFVNVKAGNEDYPLLRRPLSIHDSDGVARIEVVFRVVGLGTRILAARREGELLDLIGPLGTPFRVEPDRRALLVGGGVGLPPIHALFREIRKQGIPHIVFVGLKTKEELGLAGSIPGDAEECVVTTDDGTMERRGLVTEPLAEHLSKPANREGAAIYACGPGPLLNKVIALSKEMGVPAQVAFEQQMACGVGACIGCSIETNEGYQRVCTEGPVFDARVFY